MANQDTLEQVAEVARLEQYKALEQAFEALIEPGREIVLELQNDATENAKGSLSMTYLERSDLL